MGRADVHAHDTAQTFRMSESALPSTSTGKTRVRYRLSPA
jgi:hypothetical protein